MQLIQHDSDGPHKLVRIETLGCAVNLLVDIHDENGTPVIAVEVEPAVPDELGRVWEVNGQTAVVVRCRGKQGEEAAAVVESDPDAPLAALHQLVREELGEPGRDGS